VLVTIVTVAVAAPSSFKGLIDKRGTEENGFNAEIEHLYFSHICSIGSLATYSKSANLHFFNKYVCCFLS
jgi:hypothetical protein